ncbi:Anti-sigma regulatory factor (Ser/Thr protein kinase) [Amycolatopsis arida]|uniref:Anti-sigma regulatory factor (Ser/Thr protein kinase) n=1 Tax=Amycolatopsis arida TaxID=587909 RepID=A0A1I5YVY5_9PSEU|nr:sensor histidine kinase [Amycolatopsis arida]TDX89915.1 anti-sigma regulatory factor (Ser/Thr protein kinase) [Amycolatopsis arida]SFQ48165.1 Anti-sigma regulatory factor (Ser/Thr protein kinase) [Amycolatopsis arida]
MGSGDGAAAFVHPALLYRGQDEYLAGTVPFVLDGLTAGEPVAVAVPGPNLALLEKALGPAATSVRLLDMSEAGRNPGRILPGVLLPFANAHDGRVRIIGEPIWPGRRAAEYPACAQHEALINIAFRGRPATILCPYDVERLDPAVVTEAAATHPVLVNGTGELPSTRYDPMSVVHGWNRPLERPPDVPTRSFTVDTLRALRRFAVDRAAALGLPEPRHADLALTVAELGTNSVLHGGGSGELAIWADDDHVVCDVTDAGHLADPLAGRVPVAPDQPGGRGLLLVNQLADLVRTHTAADHTTVRAYFRR